MQRGKNPSLLSKWTNVSADQLKAHLSKYTREWAEKKSSVNPSSRKSY